MAERMRRDEFSITVTFTTDTSAYANGDLVADTQLLGQVGATDGDIVTLEAIQIVDQDNQKAAITFVFLNQNISLGTENSAPSMSDANTLASQIGQLTVAATDYITAGNGNACGTKVSGMKLQLLKPVVSTGGAVTTAGSKNLYVGIVIGTGTPTYTATGLVVTFIFSR